MAVLVAGGAGYIGSHVVRELVREGYDVVVYDNLARGHRQAVVGTPFELGDLGDEELLSKVTQARGVDAAIHLGAESLVAESMAEPAKYYLNNVAATARFLNTLRLAGVRRVVFSSSAAVYGDPLQVPIPETHPLNPTSVYGRTKVMVEQMLADFHQAYGLDYAALRYFNASGAAPQGDIGEDHSPETHLVPIVLAVALGQRHHVQVNGDDYPTPDGTCIRDYVHVSDLARAHVAALRYLENGGSSRAFNLGLGRGYSVSEVLAVAEGVTGVGIRQTVGPRREGDPAVLVAAVGDAVRDLNWRPQYTSLEAIIETAWRWHRVHPGGYGNGGSAHEGT